MGSSHSIVETRVDPGDWESAVAGLSGRQIVVGGPGSGKSEFLVRRVLHLVGFAGVDPASLVILSFGRRGVADLQRRIRAGLQRSVGNVAVATFHGFAADVLERRFADRGWSRLPQVLTGPEHVALTAQLLDRADPHCFSPAFRDVLGTTTFASEVTDFVLRARERLMDAATLATVTAGRAEWRGLADFVADYDAELRRRARIDYGSLMAEAVWIAEADPVGVAPELAHVLVDEYQDTTPAQVRLLRALATHAASVTVAADPYQSIYSFRGASVRNVADFGAEFGTAARPVRRLVLTTSFRTPRAILDAAVRVTAGGELPGAAGPVVPAPGAGRVDVHRFGQETEEAEWIAAEVQRLHLAERIPLSRMAVFVRSTRRFLPDLSRALMRRNLAHDTPDSRLADRPAVRFVLDAVVAASGRQGVEETRRAVRRLLLGNVCRAPLASVREVERGRALGATWGEAIRTAMPELTELAELLDDDRWANEAPAAEGLWHLWSSLPQLAAVVTDPQRAEERTAWASLSQVLTRWNERNPGGTLEDYRMLSENEDFEARPLLSYQPPTEDRLVLTTLHQSKGLEFDVVFIADAVEGVLPDLRARDSLLGVRHLNDEIPEDPAAYRRFRLQEERRLAYTAMTRAARRVVWTATATGFEEGRGIPSRFLAMVAGAPTVADAMTDPPRRLAPVTPREAEASLRRRVHDPSLGHPERLAALTVLVRPEHPEMRSPERFAGVGVRGPDAGLTSNQLVLSPSHAVAYLACPRRYALERRLGVGDESTVYATFGELVHRVLEVNETEAQRAGAAHGTLDGALAILDRQFDPAAFGGEPFATGWYRRAVAGFRHLYDHWPSEGETIVLERRVELTLGGARWAGYIDRVERRDAELTIVDYKTSRNPVSVESAAAAPQLGFYLLAAAADAELSQLGEPTGAEMWFPLHRAKKVTVRRFDPSRLDEVSQLLTAAAEGIRREDWRAVPGDACRRCRVRLVCPEWPEGREAFVS